LHIPDGFLTGEAAAVGAVVGGGVLAYCIHRAGAEGRERDLPVAGLAAAFFLRDEPVRVTVLEGGSGIGGKLSASEIAGVPMDAGAEALLARRPEGIDLITATSLSGSLVPAGVTSGAMYTRGALRPLPKRQFMGVPADIDELAATGVVSPEGIERARAETTPESAAGDTKDVSVAEYIGSRIGAEVVDRLVDPLLGGVYAGRSEDLSFRATLAPLAASVAKHDTLTQAAAALIPPPPPADRKDQKPKPVFLSLTTGLGALGASRLRSARPYPLREHGDHHARVPRRRFPARSAWPQRLPGAGRGREGSEGRHVLHGEVAAPGQAG
jgi:oxygen-dependent protoporphyrinogen oxidase